jgi:hypothetical protein
MQFFGRTGRLASVATAVCALTTSFALAQQPAAPPAPDTSVGLAVAGVKLGMTPDETQAALTAFESKYVIKKLYLTTAIFAFNTLGSDTISDSDKDKAYFNSMTALAEGDPPPTTHCDGGPFTGRCSTEYKDDLEKIAVWFSPTPGQEHVIAVVRTVEFHKVAPTVQSLVDGISKKYPAEKTFERAVSNESYKEAWIYDQKHRLMNEKSASAHNLLYSSDGLAQTVTDGDGVALRVEIQRDQNAEIARSVTVGLANATALYESIGQSKKTVADYEAKRNAAEAAKSAQDGTKTKF